MPDSNKQNPTVLGGSIKPEILILASLFCVTVVCCVALLVNGPSREPIKVIVELGGLTKTQNVRSSVSP